MERINWINESSYKGNNSINTPSYSRLRELLKRIKKRFED